MLATPDGPIDPAPERIVADVARLLEAWDRPPAPHELLLIGRRHMRSNNSWMHNLHVLTKGKERCILLVHPDDATARGLEDGALGQVTTDVVALHIRVEVSEDVMRGVVSAPHGWGHDLAGTRLTIANAHAGANANAIIDERLFDAPSVDSALSGVPVRASALEPAVEDREVASAIA